MCSSSRVGHGAGRSVCVGVHDAIAWKSLSRNNGGNDPAMHHFLPEELLSIMMIHPLCLHLDIEVFGRALI
jgi:hypothetical protein